MDIGDRIMGWRRFRGMTQAILAEKAGLTRPYVSRLERGDADPALSSLRRLAEALDISTGRLIDEAPPHRRLNRHEIDALARGALQPGKSSSQNQAEIRSLARVVKNRRRALGLYKPRKSGRPEESSGKHSVRWLKARLGENQWNALLRRMDKISWSGEFEK